MSHPINRPRRPLALKGRAVEIFERFVLERNARLLDLGAGGGGFAAALADRGYATLYGSDREDLLLPEARRVLAGFERADLNCGVIPWPDGFFDAVTAWEVLEHLENPYHAVREIYRVTKPGGIFIFSVPNIFHIVSRLMFLKRGLFPRWHEASSHLSLFPHGILEKATRPYFELAAEGYVHPKIELPLLRRLPWLPENQWFSNWVWYALRRRARAIAHPAWTSAAHTE